ncbi:MAG: hypothetical protein Q8L47_02650 [bacterium]|nr:hypothetical protein [bacterium]
MSRKSQILLMLIFLTFFTLPVKAIFAHGEAYYDLNPDKYFTKPLNIGATTSTISLLFQPQNDFLSAFDFWFDNSGEAGNVTFKVRDSNQILLTSKTITIPYITPISGGKRTHVDLSTQIQVSNLEIYKVEIQSSMPNLQIYYANRVVIIAHQSTTISPYLIGVVKIGSQEQIFTFKYALYEVNENGAPIVYATSTQNLSPTRTKIFWKANEPMDYKVEYGLRVDGLPTGSTTYNGSVTSCGEGEELCFLTLTVTSGTEYFYNLYTKDEWGNESVYTDTFTSEVGPSIAPTPTQNVTAPATSNSPQTSSYSPPWTQTTPISTSQTSSTLTQKYISGPENIVVVWPEFKKAESYEIKILGEKTRYVSVQYIPKGETRTLFESIPSDTYKIEIYAVQGEQKEIVQEEVTTATENSNVNFYLIIIGVAFLILIILGIIYNKYKEFL